MAPGPARGGSFLLLDVITRERGDVLAAIKAMLAIHKRAHLVREQTWPMFQTLFGFPSEGRTGRGGNAI